MEQGVAKKSPEVHAIVLVLSVDVDGFEDFAGLGHKGHGIVRDVLKFSRANVDYDDMLDVGRPSDAFPVSEIGCCGLEGWIVES